MSGNTLRSGSAVYKTRHVAIVCCFITCVLDIVVNGCKHVRSFRLLQFIRTLSHHRDVVAISSKRAHPRSPRGNRARSQIQRVRSIKGINRLQRALHGLRRNRKNRPPTHIHLDGENFFSSIQTAQPKGCVESIITEEATD